MAACNWLAASRRMVRPSRAVHAQLSGGMNQQSCPPMRRAHPSLWRKALVMRFVGVVAIGRLPHSCATKRVVPLSRRTALLWMRRPRSM